MVQNKLIFYIQVSVTNVLRPPILSSLQNTVIPEFGGVYRWMADRIYTWTTLDVFLRSNRKMMELSEWTRNTLCCHRRDENRCKMLQKLLVVYHHPKAYLAHQPLDLCQKRGWSRRSYFQGRQLWHYRLGHLCPFPCRIGTNLKIEREKWWVYDHVLIMFRYSGAFLCK